MKPAQMLYEMCHDNLTAADIKAICKSRGFSDAEAGSRSLFEHVFLTAIGVANALNSLSEAEIAALHLLYLDDQVVDVTFFSRLYDSDQGEWRSYATFTQQYKEVHGLVQRNLVRKGVLLMAAARTNSPTAARMELWRYRFPVEFGPFLPSLFQPSTHTARRGSVAADRLRAELRSLVEEGRAEQQRRAPVQLREGDLTLGSRPFSVAAVNQWRQASWESEILKEQFKLKSFDHEPANIAITRGYQRLEPEYRAATAIRPLLYAFAQLGPDRWISPDQLHVLLDVVYAGAAHPSAETICQAGWKTGCLSRIEAGGREYYCMATAGTGHTDEAPEAWLPAVGGEIFVDLEHIPYAMLEILNQLADLRVAHGRVVVAPSLRKLAPAWSTVRDHFMVRYLRAQSAAFGTALKKLDVDWGRLVIHENLLVARVTDLSLRVTLQRALGAGDHEHASLMMLADEYLVFPRGKLGEIEKLVKKAGHVIRTVGAT